MERARVKSILDRSFIYVPADKTDVRKTFEMAREKQKAEAERERQEASWRLKNVIEAKKKAR